ncbi:hypothetical protein DXG01_015626 [Tephrocybe rancida]|nr:hypothetical protein DXG01_015626 [Tephrocybe rancida]
MKARTPVGESRIDSFFIYAATLGQCIRNTEATSNRILATLYEAKANVEKAQDRIEEYRDYFEDKDLLVIVLDHISAEERRTSHIIKVKDHQKHLANAKAKRIDSFEALKLMERTSARARRRAEGPKRLMDQFQTEQRLMCVAQDAKTNNLDERWHDQITAVLATLADPIIITDLKLAESTT